MTLSLWQKQRRTKEPLDEKWKKRVKHWLKNEHSKKQRYGICPHYFMANRQGNKVLNKILSANYIGQTKRFHF